LLPCSNEDFQQRNAGRNFQSDAAASQVHCEPSALVNFGHAEGLYTAGHSTGRDHGQAGIRIIWGRREQARMGFAGPPIQGGMKPKTGHLREGYIAGPASDAVDIEGAVGHSSG
jgi:hypothetical protein